MIKSYAVAKKQEMTFSLAHSFFVLILLLLVASNEGATGGGVCTEGFMDLSLLVAKAATPVGSLADNTLADSNEGRWVINGNTFNCTSAAATEVLFGVDIRSKDGNRNKYPSIEIWQAIQWNGDSYYSKRDSIPIILSPDNVTTNGLYRFILPTPFSVSGSNYNTYRLGVYQPEDDSGVVRLYNATTSSTETVGVIRADSISESNIRTSGLGREIDFYTGITNIFMVHLKTDPPNCFENIFTETEINTNSLSVTNVIPVTDTRAFPDIQFTCNGIITNWIIGITQNQDTSKHYPNIYLKRSSQLIHALTVDASAATSSNGNVYNFTSDIEVQYGDILVINVPTNSNPMYYQQYNGPLNYELDSSNGLIPLEHNDYPLISVVVGKSLGFVLNIV
uniref:IgGFc-binding protein N-terminal domain-containing protein n=1 Tax=Amphimedon queenslandica TaxID=400682 RepID=A0A1X7T348_AMPQE